MEKDKRAIKFLTKHWISVWLVLASVLFFVVMTVFAAYEDENKKIKRVIAPSAKSDSLFTSNYLALGTTNIKSAFFETTPYEYDVIIRNYNPSDPETIFDGNLPYTLSVELAHKDGTTYDADDDATALSAMTSGNKSITITCESDPTATITLDGTHLSGSGGTHTLNSTTRENTWHVVYTDNIGLDSDYCVKFTAVPAASTNLDDISSTIIVSSYPTVHQEGWECVLVESGIIEDYDAFNYTISGTGNKTLKFSYDSSKLTVNTAFYTLDKNNDIAAPVAYSGSGSHDSNWKTIVITAEPDTTKVNRYDLQVYKINPYQPVSFAEITPIKPSESGSYIEFEFV